MKILLISALTILMLAPEAKAADLPTQRAQSVKEVKAHMIRYVGLVNQLDFETVAKEIYQAPVLMKPLGENAHTARTTEEFQEIFEEHFRKLKSQDFEKIKILKLEVDLSGSDLAFVKMTFVWLKSDGKPLGPAQHVASYVLIKKNAGWRTVSVLGNSN